MSPERLVADSNWHAIWFDLEPACTSVDLSSIVAIQLVQHNPSGSEEVVTLTANRDDIVFHPRLFTDGFESGALTAWSFSVGGPG